MLLISTGKGKQPRRKRRPDEVFQAGPIVFARYGRLTVAKNIATPEQHKKFLETLPKTYAELTATISTEIETLRALLGPLDPIRFLQQAFGEFFVAHLGIEDEPSVTFDDHGVPARLIDYCQSLFAAMPANQDARAHTEDEFQAAKEHIRTLFRTTQHYIGLRSHSAISGTENDALSELLAKLTYHWVFVRSDRHAYFEISHHRDLFEPLNVILQKVIGVTAEDLVRGLEKLVRNAQSGLGDSGLKLAKLHEAASTHPDFEKLLEAEDGYNFSDLANLTGMSEAEIEDAFRSFLGTRLFEVEKATGWPVHLIKLLSYAPAEAANFLQSQGDAGWPTRVWPIFQRSFLRVGDESYCFDHIAFCDRFYRQVTRALRSVHPSCATQLKDIQAANVETIATKLLRHLLEGAQVYRNVFYECDGELCETDLILTYKDTVIIVEVRSASITPESPTEDVGSYFDSIQNLLLKPASQAWRLLGQLDKGPVGLFDSNKSDRSSVGLLNHLDFSFRIPMTVSLDHLYMMGAQFENTLSAIEKKIPPVWAVTLDDLRCFAELFNSPSIFLHFAKIRMRAAAHKKVAVLDEMDHVGLYFVENDYVMQSDDFDFPLSRQGYTTDIDRYFFKLGAGEVADRPKQKMQNRIVEAIEACDHSKLLNSRAVAATILGLDSETRSIINKWLDDQLTSPPATGRFRNCTIPFGSNSLSLFGSRSWGLHEIQHAFVEAKARLLTMEQVDTMQVALFQFGANFFKLTSCSEVWKASIGERERISLQSVRAAQEKRDMAMIPAGVGRNDTCPCGSGLKYKRCHGR